MDRAVQPPSPAADAGADPLRRETPLRFCAGEVRLKGSKKENDMRPKAQALAGCLSLAVALLLPAAAGAQIDTASIVGTVTDTSGAVLPGVTVTATQDGTGFTTVATTNSRGQYVFSTLRIGKYTLAGELPNFKRAVHRDVPLSIQQRLEVNLVLELGALAEEVVVSGESALLQTQTGDMGHSVDQRQLTDLPLLGRRYTELALLQTGVVQGGQGIQSLGEDSFFNANGNFATWNNFTLDGGDNNSFSTNLQERTPQVIQPPVDALEEFRIQTRTYSAEFGRSAGAVVNASIKQGSNQYRGTAFGFLRDEAFNANTWENEQAQRAKGKYNQYIYGATLGGPLLKNKLFFFADYQGTRQEQALSLTGTVPTPLMRQGNLSELPAANALRPSTLFPASCLDGQTIVASCIDPVAQRLINLYPMPNIPSAVARQGQPGSFGLPNYINNGVLDVNIDQFDLRLDYKPGGSDSFFARYSQSKTSRDEPPLLGPIASGDFNSLIDIKGQSAVGGWTRVLSPALLAEVRGAWNKMDGDTIHHAFGIDSNAEFGIRGVPQDPRYSGGIPNTNIGGLTRLGGPFFRPQFQTSQVYQALAMLTWNRASHSMKFGVERRRDRVDYIDLRALNGLLTFSNGRYTNSGIGDFLVGMASSQGLTLFHEADLHTDGWSLFAQDSWRASKSLTLNYGLRYEYFTPMQDANDVMTNIDPATGRVITAIPGGSLYERTLIHPDKNNIGPRVSFAWSPSSRWALRGGYGLFYQHTDRYGSESQLALNPPQLIDVNLNANSANDPPAMILRNGFAPVSAANVNPAAVQWRIQDPNQKTPTIQQFSFGPEMQFMGNMTASVEYVGNLVRNGRRLRNLNQGRIEGNTVVFPYAQYGYGSAYLEQIVTNGRSNYHALQAKLQRRMSGGLAFTASYTYGKALSDFLEHLAATNNVSGNTPQNAYDMAADYGPIEFDVRHRGVLSFVYQLPAGKGRKTQLSGAGGALLNDWSVNGILSLNSGRPMTITANDQTGTGAGHITRANCLGDAQPSGFDKAVTKWFDTTQFSAPGTRQFGSCGSGTVRGPGFKSLNMSVFRSFPLSNDRRVEFRIEGFNVLDWTNYALPGRNVSAPATFGVITGTVGTPREMQFAIKLYY